MNDLPRSLTRFEPELGRAIRRDLGSRRRLRRPAVRFSLAAAAAAAVALGVLSLLPGTGPNVVARAAAAISGSGDSILHVDAVVRDSGNGASSSWRFESWQENSEPFASRWLRAGPANLGFETLSDNGATEIYDPATNTIYTNSAGAHELNPGSPVKPSQPAYHAKPSQPSYHGPPPSKVGGQPEPKGPPLSKAGGQPPPKPSQPQVPGDPYRAKILALLQSGAVSVSGHATVDGRDTLRLGSDDGQATIYVDPQTYRPVEFRTSTDGRTETTTFQTYEELPRNQANEALVSLTAQHSSARVDDSAADYVAAVARLGGKH